MNNNTQKIKDLIKTEKWEEAKKELTKYFEETLKDKDQKREEKLINFAMANMEIGHKINLSYIKNTKKYLKLIERLEKLENKINDKIKVKDLNKQIKKTTP